MTDLAIVIPAYNEARTIREIAVQALRQTDSVIVIDDGSSDGTSDALAGLPIVLARHPANQGKAAALRAGFRIALEGGANFIATVDGDGQHVPADIPRLYRVARMHPQRIVIGARLRERRTHPVHAGMRTLLGDFWISWAAGYPIADSQSGERVYPASLLREVQARHSRVCAFTLESELLIRGAELGYESVSVPIAAIYQQGARASHFRPVLDFARIGVLVAKSLLTRWMNLPGLWRSLRSTPVIVDETAVTVSPAPMPGQPDSIPRNP